MPIISHTDRKGWKGFWVVAQIYALLIVGGITMIYPFAITLTGALATPYDYERRAPLPRHLWARSERFLRMLCAYFPPSYRNSLPQMRAAFPDLPEGWQTWTQIGDDQNGGDVWAARQLKRLNGAEAKHLRTQARDYGDWMQQWNLQETILAYDARHVAPFLRARYGSLEKFNAAWEVSVDDFAKIAAPEWSGEPIDQAAYVPILDTRYSDLLAFRRAYRDNLFTSHLKGDNGAANLLRPAWLRYGWEAFASKNGLGSQTPFLPFPATNSTGRVLQVWREYLKTEFPMRHVVIDVSPQRQAQFTAFVTNRFRNIEYFNEVSGRSARSWSEIQLSPQVPPGTPTSTAMSQIWIDFVRTAVPVETWRIRDTLPEAAFQKAVWQKYGSLEALNRAWGTQFNSLQQVPIPFGAALLHTFNRHERQISWSQSTSSYATALDYLFQRGQAVRNTVILVLLSIFVTLTVNPLAGYALSRFRLRAGEQIIIFCLATMAFPAAVAAIPSFLLLRDMGLLNTFAALVLPTAANGMSIFLLKGFFDSLPKELYEAATIDGAPEWQVFWKISIPLVKPILAVSMLTAFLSSYNGWEWALIVCQDPQMWTVSVWTYQFSQTLGNMPFVVMAAFVLNSIPVLMVFLACQKIILRGIILPQMK